MVKKRLDIKPQRILGITLFLIGSVLILNSFSGMTGFVVAGNVSRGFSSIIGLVLVIVGVLVMIGGLEKSIKDAVQMGVPLRDAKRVYDEANRKVESGEWVELKPFGLKDSSNPGDYPDAHSLVRYWGPKEYKGLSGKKLDRLFKDGKIGKTHDIQRGIRRHLSEGSRALHRHWKIDQMYDHQKSSRPH